MNHGWFPARWRAWASACAILAAAAGSGRADDVAELRALIEKQARLLEQQGKELQDLKQQIQQVVPGGGSEESQYDPAKPKIGDDAARKIIAEYLRDNPGAGMPSGVQVGYSTAPLTPRIGPGGFVIRSAPNPRYIPWADDSRIPFELRIRGRIQLAYARYKATDNTNHLTNSFATQNANTSDFADFSQLLIKRGNIIFEGTAFNPDLRYRVNFNGFSRGAGGFQNNEVVQTIPAGGFTPSATAVSPIGGGVLVTQPVTLFECFVAYDMHGCCCEKGCGPDCPPDQPKYCPTYTLLGGKMKPFFGLDEFLGNQNMQFVEFSMANYMFDADDDARLMAAGFEVRALEDRFFMQALVTNGSEAFTPNLQMDQYPGFIAGFWYDLGGRWNEQRKAWDLFGDCISDIDHSCCWAARVGGSINLVPMDCRSLYGDAEQARYFTMPGGPVTTIVSGPGGTRLINLLNGGVGTLPPGSHAVDKFEAYTYNVFAAAKYRGFSISNEWWFRSLNGFHSTPNGRDSIIYQDTLGPGFTARNALFPRGGLFDYGMNVATGYFLIPKKLEVAARWAWVRGRSGDVNGNGTFTNVTIPGVAGVVHVVDGAFTRYAEANEYTLGLNYFFKRHAVKWQTDFSVYDGGNPAGGGQSIANYIAGVDGWLLRTQLQFAF